MLQAHQKPEGRLVSLSDRLLLPRHVRGDRDAFAQFVRRYNAPVYGYLCRTGVPAADRDDVFQEIFVKIHRNADRYSPDRPLSPWVFTVAINTVRSYFRTKTTRPEGTEAELRDSMVAARAEATATEMHAARETAAWLDEEIAKLALPLREVVILCCIEQADQNAAAEALGIPLNTLKTRLRRARMHLAEARLRRQATIQREASR